MKTAIVRWLLTALLLVWVATGSRVALVITLVLVCIAMEALPAVYEKKKPPRG